MNRSTPDLPVHHQLLESTQTHVHWVSDAIQPSHPLLSTLPGFAWQVAEECMVTPCSLFSNDLSLFSLQLGRKGWTQIVSTAPVQCYESPSMSSYPLRRKPQLQPWERALNCMYNKMQMKPISQGKRGMYLEELIFPSGRISVYLFFAPLSMVDKKRSLSFSRTSLALRNQWGTRKGNNSRICSC